MLVMGFDIEREVSYHNCGIMKTDGPWRHLPRVFDLWVLALCTAGTMYMTIEGVAYTIRPGDVFLLPPKSLHFGPSDSDGPISYYWVHFEAPELNAVSEKEPVNVKQLPAGRSYLMYHMSLLDVNTVSMLFHQLYVNNYTQLYTPNLQESLLRVLLYEISNQTLYRHAHKFDQRFIQLLDYIRSRFAQGISIDELSQRFGYNKSYLCRLFKSRVGKTINGYLAELRVCYACQLLSETNEPVRTVAIRVGFESEKYFMRVFKQHMSMTPTAYRNAHKIAIFEEIAP